ncbi:MAG TPA: hypothetical protein VGR37_00300 [Longimicrobiaceae bacterium]|nr:hypothetical protein [Longimicrobiaceae bacterium]
MGSDLPKRALVLALLAVAACGGEDEEPPPPNPVPTPGVPVIPVEGKRVPVTRIPPVGFEWPGGVAVASPRPGVISATYYLDNPCRHVPRGAVRSFRGDTVAVVVRWPRVEPDSSRKCPQDTTPDAFRIEFAEVPSGPHTFAMFEAIEGQTAAALSHVTEVEVQ